MTSFLVYYFLIHFKYLLAHTRKKIIKRWLELYIHKIICILSILTSINVNQ
ncbi:hypothetical protein BDF14DRAFT_1382575 [Spinellus fusiger]|nr:hypothetical protein BDF14DRAFT_1382575 [Spinellus fusiger]